MSLTQEELDRLEWEEFLYQDSKIIKTEEEIALDTVRQQLANTLNPPNLTFVSAPHDFGVRVQPVIPPTIS